MKRYRVTLTHDDLAGPLVLDLMASSPQAATARGRMGAVQMYRHPELLNAQVQIYEITEDEFNAGNEVRA